VKAGDKQKKMYRITAAVLFVCSSAIGATINFTDGFEGATVNPFWNDVQGATLTNARAHTGLQSILVGGSLTSGGSSLIHRVNENGFGQVGVYIYDDLTLDGPGFSEGLLAGNLQVYAAERLPNYLAAGAESNVVTNVARTLGWHQFLIMAGPSGGNIQIDGTVVSSWTTATPFNSVYLFQQNPLSATYFDDFAMTETPEPGTIALTMAGLCGAILIRRGASWRPVEPR